MKIANESILKITLKGKDKSTFEDMINTLSDEGAKPSIGFKNSDLKEKHYKLISDIKKKL